MKVDLLFECLVRGSVVLVAVGLLLACLRRRTAVERRHCLVGCGLLLLLLPVVVALDWRWHWLPDVTQEVALAPLPSGEDSSIFVREAHRPPLEESVVSSAAAEATLLQPSRPAGLHWWLGIYLVGVCVALLPLGGAWSRLNGLRRRSEPCEDAELLRCARSIPGYREGLVRMMDSAVMPMTWGIWRPIVLLPKAALSWL